MAITTQQVGAGIGTAAVGVTAAEVIQHAEERDLVSERAGSAVAAATGVGTLGLGVGTLAGVGPLSPTAGAALSGYGIGTLGWYVGRDRGVAPRITIDVPAEVNLAGPLVTGAVVATAGLAATTIAALVA